MRDNPGSRAALVGLAMCVALGLGSCRHARQGERLSIRGVPSLDPLVADIIAGLRQAHPELEVTADCLCPPCAVPDKHSPEPFDVWLVWGRFELDQVTASGAAEFARMEDVGETHLALVTVPELADKVKGLCDLGDPAVTGVGLGDPSSVAVGNYAQKALESCGLWTSVESKMVKADTGCETLKNLSMGTSYNAAIVLDACVAHGGRLVHVAQELGPDVAPAVPLVAAVEKAAPHPDSPEKLLEFLRSPQGQQALTRNRVTPLGSARDTQSESAG